jgi:hypothetical protein
MVALTGLDRPRVKRSSASSPVSPVTLTATVLVVWPASNTSEPWTDSKSAPAVAVPAEVA